MNSNFEFLILNFELYECASRAGLSSYCSMFSQSQRVLHHRPYHQVDDAFIKQARAKRAHQFKINNSKFKIQGLNK